MKCVGIAYPEGSVAAQVRRLGLREETEAAVRAWKKQQQQQDGDDSEWGTLIGSDGASVLANQRRLDVRPAWCALEVDWWCCS